MKEIVSKNEDQTKKIAETLCKEIKGKGIICMYGDLGTGKTLMAKAMAQKLGIENFLIKSPTYTYIREYKSKKINFYHIDLYRIDGEDELLKMEIEEILDEGNKIVIIEWAEKLKMTLPKGTIKLWLEYIDTKTRKIKYETIE